ncbi:MULTISPECIES: hypothetical protein [Nonomuraea]|uniref:Uncharacterized protein n=1 Tax=Nonomuraea africana TaxID=46171 RepID=A0ABR9KX41_9ACTN|nr:hypothetical protein [Nonomuraea africana]MBE1566585.1 hypothetical protein [Nonomuraea africana]
MQVKCTLANPLGTDDSRDIGLEARVHRTGEQITVNYSDAMRLVGAGYIKDARHSDQESIRKALVPVKASAAGKGQ